jgi:hypothetical protein
LDDLGFVVDPHNEDLDAISGRLKEYIRVNEDGSFKDPKLGYSVADEQYE